LYFSGSTPLLDIAVVGKRLVDLEMVSPGGYLQAS